MDFYVLDPVFFKACSMRSSLVLLKGVTEVMSIRF